MRKIISTLGSIIAILLLSGLSSASVSSATAESPATNTWDSDRIVTFNCSGATGSNATLVNISLIIDGVYNTTNTTFQSGGGNSTIVIKTFTVDSCAGKTWKCEVCDNETTCLNSSSKVIKIDATAPTVTAPSDTIIKRGALLVYASTDVCDSSLTLKWTKDAGVTNSTSFLYTNDVETDDWSPGTFTVTVYATDDAGNEGSGSVTDLEVKKSGVLYVQPSGQPQRQPLAETVSQPSGTVGQIIAILTFNVSGMPLFAILGIIALVGLFIDAGKRKPRKKKRSQKRSKKRK